MPAKLMWGKVVIVYPNGQSVVEIRPGTQILFQNYSGRKMAPGLKGPVFTKFPLDRPPVVDDEIVFLSEMRGYNNITVWTFEDDYKQAQQQTPA